MLLYIPYNSRWTAGFRLPAEARYLNSVQPGSGVQTASYPKNTVALSPGVKRPGREADHSPSSSAKVKNGGAKPPLPRMPSWNSA
jgi:hypothetical protein